MLEGCSGCIVGSTTRQSFTALQLHRDLEVGKMFFLVEIKMVEAFRRSGYSYSKNQHQRIDFYRCLFVVRYNMFDLHS